MLLREEPGGTVLAIAQPAHAALAGRLAEAWDDDLPPRLVVAAGHHDDVWTSTDRSPRLHPPSGRPQTFVDLDVDDRVAVWSRASQVAAPLGPEAELWVLRHAERLHADRNAAVLKAMTASISARIDALIEGLRARGPGFDDAALARGTSLLALWDTLALRLCFGVDEPVQAGVLRLRPSGDAVAVAPWPFVGARVATTVRTRRLTAPVTTQAELDAAWAAAEPFDLPLTLVRAD